MWPALPGIQVLTESPEIAFADVAIRERAGDRGLITGWRRHSVESMGEGWAWALKALHTQGRKWSRTHSHPRSATTKATRNSKERVRVVYGGFLRHWSGSEERLRFDWSRRASDHDWPPEEGRGARVAPSRTDGRRGARRLPPPRVASRRVVSRRVAPRRLAPRRMPCGLSVGRSVGWSASPDAGRPTCHPRGKHHTTLLQLC